jgi:hypothetical protein
MSRMPRMPRTSLKNAAVIARRVAAAAGVSAVVAMVAVSVAVAQKAPQTTAGVGSAITTSTVPPTAPVVSSAYPVVKATFFGKH